MNLPNRLTLVRIALVPVYLVLLTGGEFYRWMAALVFSVAAITDLIDGKIARKRGLVTDFGKFMDPIADKLLVLLPFVYFCCESTQADMIPVLLMIAREIIVSGFRLVAAGRGIVLAAGRSGKVKTAVQMIAVIMLTLVPPWPWLTTPAWIATWICGALSVWSGWEILWKNRQVLEEEA